MKRTLGALSMAVVVLFVPNLLHLQTAAFGSSGSDALKHVWSQWFVQHQVLSEGGLSLRTDLLNHPSGGPFFSLDTINALMGLPLRLFFDSVATYNLVLIACIGASALTGAALVRMFSDEPWVPSLGGIAFALSAWMLCFPLASGVSETAVTWPLPLIVLFSIRTWTTPRYTSPIAAGLLLTIQGAACWSHGITAGLIVIGMIMVAWTVNRADFRDSARLRRVFVLFGSAALCSLPLYLAISGTVSADDSVKVRNLSLFHSAPLGPLDVPEANSMALVDFFAPGSWGRRISTTGTDQLQYAAYPGFILIALAVMAVRRRIPWAKTLAMGVVLMALLSMGPRIYLDHARTLGGIPNPIYLAAYWIIPLVNITIHSVDRFAVGLQLCLSILAALGLTQVTQRWRPWVIAGVVAEVLLVSPGPWPIPMVQAAPHPASQHIAAQPDTGAVIDLPFQKSGTENSWFYGDIFLQQITHQRPIPFQLEGKGMETASKPVAQNRFFQHLSSGLIFGQPFPEDCSGVEELEALGVSWIIWHPTKIQTDMQSRVDRVLRSCLGKPETFDDRKVFKLKTTP